MNADLEQLDAMFLTDLDAKFTGIVPTGRLLLASTGQVMNSLKSSRCCLCRPTRARKKSLNSLINMICGFLG